MKPVVSSIVALAIAFAPFAATASPDKSAHKPVAAKVSKQNTKKVEKTAKLEKADKADKADKTDKAERAEKAENVEVVVRVRHSGKALLKPVLHHAHGVEVGGAGHKEPKIEPGVAVVPASLTSKSAHGKTAHVSPVAHKQSVPATESLPKLPNPNATKASKAGNEKGAKKASEKKSESADGDGQPGRDGDFADLVARIRGKHAPKHTAETDEQEPEAKPEPKPERKARNASARSAACAKDPIEVIRGPEIDTFELTNCDGTVAPLAVEHLSVLIRPGSAARPIAPLAELARKKGAELSRGIHRVDERLAIRLQALADHFGKPGTPVKLSVVSGYRPTSIGSMHATGRAIDFRLEGAKNEDVVAFCKTLTDTGCGFYPNSSFVHLDVRDPGAGHVSWIDASGPGETPRYVSAWPLRAARSEHEALEPASAKEPISKGEKQDCDGEPEAVDAHPGDE